MTGRMANFAASSAGEPAGTARTPLTTPTAPDPASDLKARIDPDRVPQHIAIIMDGNGRWAQRPLPSMMMAMCCGTRSGSILAFRSEAGSGAVGVVKGVRAVPAGSPAEEAAKFAIRPVICSACGPRWHRTR